MISFNSFRYDTGVVFWPGIRRLGYIDFHDSAVNFPWIQKQKTSTFSISILESSCSDSLLLQEANDGASRNMMKNVIILGIQSALSIKNGVSDWNRKMIGEIESAYGVSGLVQAASCRVLSMGWFSEGR